MTPSQLEIRNGPISQIPKVTTTLFALLFLTSTCSAFVPRGGVGVLKMCPPGGEAFATAWQLTCGMRKKRSVDFNEQAAAALIKEHSETPTPATITNQEDLLVEDVTEMDPTVRSRRAAGNQQVRPLKLTEMMHFCCRYGCSFRDLLPYCDPFGSWDS